MNGAHVQKVVNKGSNREHVNVTHRLHNMGEESVKANLWIQEFATRKYHVQVTNKGSQLSIDVVYCSGGTPTMTVFCVFVC